MTSCANASARIRTMLAEQDLYDAQRRISAARKALHAAEDALDAARDDLRRAQAAECRRLGDLNRIRRQDTA